VRTYRAADGTQVRYVLVVPAGPKVIRFVPPLIITEKEVAQAMRQVDDALKVLSKK
jgi:acetylornithine aminotransferase